MLKKQIKRFSILKALWNMRNFGERENLVKDTDGDGVCAEVSHSYSIAIN